MIYRIYDFALALVLYHICWALLCVMGYVILDVVMVLWVTGLFGCYYGWCVVAWVRFLLDLYFNGQIAPFALAFFKILLVFHNATGAHR